MLKQLAVICLLALTQFVSAQKKPAPTPVYKDAKVAINLRIADLLQHMTIEEKAGQLNQLNGGVFTGPAVNDANQQAKVQMVRESKVGSFLNVTGVKETRNIQKVAVEETRLGIPILFAFDVIHGYKTIFPIPLAEACSWDLPQIEKNSGVAAKKPLPPAFIGHSPLCAISAMTHAGPRNGRRRRRHLVRRKSCRRPRKRFAGRSERCKPYPVMRKALCRIWIVRSREGIQQRRRIAQRIMEQIPSAL
jgi:hypothetical protein